jgi:hypothetical protein
MMAIGIGRVPPLMMSAATWSHPSAVSKCTAPRRSSTTDLASALVNSS